MDEALNRYLADKKKQGLNLIAMSVVACMISFTRPNESTLHKYVKSRLHFTSRRHPNDRLLHLRRATKDDPRVFDFQTQDIA
jgi:hypothetical protein